MTTKPHWENVYETKSAHEVSWYRPRLEVSLQLIDSVLTDPGSAIIDIGGGESTLVDDLIRSGRSDVTVLDISQAALDATKARLGASADSVSWIAADITTIDLGFGRYDLWHDRAVFHFLTRPEDRDAYIQRVRQAVKPQGYIVVATFGPDGPLKCSGLDIVRYDSNSLVVAFGDGFDLLDTTTEIHKTPWDSEQEFVYCLMRKS
ncbi:class I SAM-dependent methyltransferase [Brevundimonas sp.]|uniref:class I SAM-dependent methyltransferase n=1 Tax=Brevundimonas sp. TaxID=1871086 RepID=UPI00289912D2|nr:class I SAM-dependent methyltransferase [Brevundimonas sp.]